MNKTRRNALALVSLLTMLWISAGEWSRAVASTPTPSLTLTPSRTLTPSATLNNTQIIAAATLAPPSQCGTIYMPCGPLPWNVPFMPTLALASPTIRPTLPSPTPIPVTATPSQTLTFTPTPTLGAGTYTLTPTPALDVSSIQTQISAQQNQISTLQALGTQQVSGLNGTPVDMNGSAGELATLIGPMISQVKGVTGAASQSRTTSLITFAALVLGFILLVMIVTLLLPIIMNLIRLALQVIAAVKP